jgi:hypothetical protein
LRRIDVGLDEEQLRWFDATLRKRARRRSVYRRIVGDYGQAAVSRRLPSSGRIFTVGGLADRADA